MIDMHSGSGGVPSEVQAALAGAAPREDAAGYADGRVARVARSLCSVYNPQNVKAPVIAAQRHGRCEVLFG